MDAVWLFSYFSYYSFLGRFEVGVEQKNVGVPYHLFLEEKEHVSYLLWSALMQRTVYLEPWFFS